MGSGLLARNLPDQGLAQKKPIVGTGDFNDDDNDDNNDDNDDNNDDDDRSGWWDQSQMDQWANNAYPIITQQKPWAVSRVNKCTIHI